MLNANRPNPSDLPSTPALLKSTGLALVIASGLLVAVVLPAEYGIDPTRIGSAFGLTEMGRVKRQLAAEAAAEASTPSAVATAPAASQTLGAQPASPASADARTDEMQLTLAPDQGAEIKLTMKEGASARFNWTSSGGKVNYDTHGDRPGVSYHGYGKGSSPAEQGVLTAAFDGKHGWFWRNRTGAPVTITLKTTGAYSAIKRVA